MRLQHGPKVSGNILGLVWACVLGSGGQPRRKQKVPSCQNGSMYLKSLDLFAHEVYVFIVNTQIHRETVGSS
jgi:hypothetical protein